jgi:hypothetical protein
VITAKFPEPPTIDELRKIPPVISVFPAGTVFARIFFAGGRFPGTWDAFRYYGPMSSRFDHHFYDSKNQPCEQERGIMYLSAGAESIPTCLAEAFQIARVIDRQSRIPHLVGFEIANTVSLLDLRGVFSTKIGASSAIHSGQRPRAQRWSQALYLAYPQIHGILYCSSMYGNHPAIALFERAKNCIPPRPIFHRELLDPVLLQVITETGEKIGYGII